MTRGRPEYTTLEHTADAALLVRAPDERALFERAALAMLDLMFDVEGVGETAVADVEWTAADREELLVGFLGEVLAHALLGPLAIGAVDVTAIAPPGPDGRQWRVTARLWGEPLDVHRHGFKSEVKAVTYHHLLVAEDADGWSARLVFDI